MKSEPGTVTWLQPLLLDSLTAWARVARQRSSVPAEAARDHSGVICISLQGSWRPPVIEGVNLVGNWQSRGEQLCEGAHYVSRLHVLAFDVIFADEQDA